MPDAPTPPRAAVDAGELRRLTEAATPLPWAVYRDEWPQSVLGEREGLGANARVTLIGTAWRHPQLDGPAPVVTSKHGPYNTPEGAVHVSDADAAYLVAAANGLPALLDRLDALEAALRAVEWAGGWYPGASVTRRLCPACHGMPTKGHAAECAIGALALGGREE